MTEEKPQHDPWADALQDLDIDIDDTTTSFVTPFSDEVIANAASPQDEELMQKLREQHDAITQSLEKKTVEREEKQAGWSIGITIRTPDKKEVVLGLYNVWMGDSLKLFIPQVSHLTEEEVNKMVQSILDVEPSKTVSHTSRYTLNPDSNNNAQYFLQETDYETGEISGYTHPQEKKWAKYWGPREENGGRVWFDIQDDDGDIFMANFPQLSGGSLRNFSAASRKNIVVSTWNQGYDRYNEHAPDSPNFDKDAVQKYRDKFIKLAVAVALKIGTPINVSTDFHTMTDTPETFYRKHDVNDNTQSSFTRNIYEADEDGITYLLRRGHNSAVSWSSYAGSDIHSPITAEDLETLMHRQLLF